MSRQAQLPPRCPFQNKGSPSSRVLDSGSLIVPRSDELESYHRRHRRFPSQSSVLDEQPSWLDELLNDPETNVKGTFHRRSASDPVAFLEVPSTLPRLTPLVDKEKPIHSGAYRSHGEGGLSVKTAKYTGPVTKQEEETGDCVGLDAGCIFGPNSPRRRSNLTSSEYSIVSAFSEYASRNNFPYLPGNLSHSSETDQSDAKGDACGDAICDLDPDTKATKRHSGQRSRVRKLQYIAELERTVNVLECRL
ncbi:bZIP protein isoform X2 [Tasmannia lanceolata]|uniref:bZIP protein isoform X2 n=1 Tax=Tasmannia lanceolata TaxID=3420 RepID=UPI004063EF06